MRCVAKLMRAGTMNEVLERFAPQIAWVTDSVAKLFYLQPNERNDLGQEACLYVLSYAGITPWPTSAGRHFGDLAKWETEATKSVNALLAYTLRLDLSEKVARAKKKGPKVITSVEVMVEFGLEPLDDEFENRMADKVYKDGLSKRYPEFVMHVVESMTIDEIVAVTGKSRATVFRRIDAQKRSFLRDQVRHGGLTVEGDETLDELNEALENLKVVRR